MFVDATLQEAQNLRAAMRQQVEQLRPGDVLASNAPTLWRAYDGIERLASTAKTLLAQRVDESREWARQGDRSAADHLARTAGISRSQARSGLATSKKLGQLPRTEAALRRGELSRPQADAIADAAAANPDAEQDLLAAASQESLSELRQRCDRAKAAADPDPDATHRRTQRERRLRQYTDAQGAWNAVMRGTPDAGAIFNAALQPIIDELFQQARREGRHEARDAYAFDAAIELARRAYDQPDDLEEDDDTDSIEVDQNAATVSDPADTGDNQDDAANHDRDHATSANDHPSTRPTSHSTDPDAAPDGDATTPDAEPRDANGPGASSAHAATRAAGRRNLKPRRDNKKRPKRTNPKFLALLRVDLEALLRGRVQGDELCELAGIGPIPARVARGLLGDSIMKLVMTRGVDVANVTHLGRGPTAAQRIAALWMSPYCTNQGCPHVFNIQHDHREPWTQVHETVLDNLDRLCGACHWLKTHEGWALVEGTGPRPLVPPDDPRHPNNQASPAEPPDQHSSNRTDTSAGGPATAAPDQQPSGAPSKLGGPIDGQTPSPESLAVRDGQPSGDPSDLGTPVDVQAPSSGSHAAVSSQHPAAPPAETLRPDPTLFDNAVPMALGRTPAPA